jgi:SAM-dependent methyltransferase
LTIEREHFARAAPERELVGRAREDGACALCGSKESRVRFVKLARRFVRCEGCGLVWVDPMPTREALAAYYDSAYEGRYALFADATEIRRLIAAHRLERIRGAHDGPISGRWLDVGCSTGDFVEVAGAAGASVEGIDAARGAIESARARGLAVNLTLVEDFSPASPYSLITAFDVIEHLLDPRDFVRRLCGWLEPGGRLVLTLPDVRSIYPRLLMRSHWFYYWPDEHLFYFDPKTIARLLEEEGFAVESVRRAYKPLTLDYSATNLGEFNVSLGRLARALVGLLPASLRGRPIPTYLGEMMVVARRVEGRRT